jgi:hypothetical protein
MPQQTPGFRIAPASGAEAGRNSWCHWHRARNRIRQIAHRLDGDMEYESLETIKDLYVAPDKLRTREPERTFERMGRIGRMGRMGRMCRNHRGIHGAPIMERQSWTRMDIDCSIPGKTCIHRTISLKNVRELKRDRYCFGGRRSMATPAMFEWQASDST